MQTEPIITPFIAYIVSVAGKANKAAGFLLVVNLIILLLPWVCSLFWAEEGSSDQEVWTKVKAMMKAMHYKKLCIAAFIFLLLIILIPSEPSFYTILNNLMYKE